MNSTVRYCTYLCSTMMSVWLLVCVYSQALRLTTICSTSTEFDKNCAIIKQKFLGRQYKEEVLDDQIKKADRIESKELFTCKEKNSNKNNSAINNIQQSTP